MKLPCVVVLLGSAVLAGQFARGHVEPAQSDQEHAVRTQERSVRDAQREQNRSNASFGVPPMRHAASRNVQIRCSTNLSYASAFNYSAGL